MPILSCFPGGSTKNKLNAVAIASAVNLPGAADEGTIAVITTMTIPNVYASVEAPGSPENGDVWVMLGNSSAAPIPFSDFITLYPVAVYQWSGTAFVLRTAYVFLADEWVEMTLAIYDYGVEKLSTMSVRDEGYFFNGVTIVKQAAAVYSSKGYSIDGSFRYFSTDQAIDLTNVSKIRMTYTRSADYRMNFYISTANTGISQIIYTAGASGSLQVADLDVSAYSGLYYIGIDSGAAAEEDGYGYLHKLELIR